VKICRDKPEDTDARIDKVDKIAEAGLFGVAVVV
jgi:hypothetical protein